MPIPPNLNYDMLVRLNPRGLLHRNEGCIRRTIMDVRVVALRTVRLGYESRDGGNTNFESAAWGTGYRVHGSHLGGSGG